MLLIPLAFRNTFDFMLMVITILVMFTFELEQGVPAPGTAVELTLLLASIEWLMPSQTLPGANVGEWLMPEYTWAKSSGFDCAT